MRYLVGRHLSSIAALGAVCVCAVAFPRPGLAQDYGSVSSLVLSTGVVNSVQLTSGSATVLVAPGAALSGFLQFLVNSKYPAGTTMSMGLTPTWGPPSSSFTDLGGFTSPATGLQKTVPFSLTAPTVVGAYYIIAAFRSETTAANLMSGTAGPAAANWTSGDAVASWSPATIGSAQASGTVPVNYLFPAGNQITFVPATAVEILVTSASTAVQSVTLSSGSITGGGTITGTVTLVAAAPSGGAVVSLSSASSAASVPASVTVPAGATSATFTVTAGNVAATQSVTIAASYGGISAQAGLSVTPPAPAVQSVTLSGSSVLNGGTVTGTVTLSSAAPSGGAVVSLSSGSPGVASVPGAITISAGAVSATFVVTAGTVNASQTVTITASYGGASAGATLTVTSAQAPLVQAVTLSSVSVAGGGTVTGTVTLSSAAPSGGAVVSLSSSSSAASVPATLTIAAGATSATFSVVTVNVSSRQTVTIKASYGAGSAQASLTVAPPTVIQSLALSAGSVASGGTVSGTVTLSATAPSGGAVVSLSSSSPSVASVPATATVPAGATSATFTATAAGVSSIQTVTITASYGGSSAQVGLTVTLSASQDTSLVGWWRFGETSGATVNDSSVYGNTGTLTGTYSRVQGKVSPDAVSFGGKSHVGNAQPDVNFPTGSGPRTMTAWIRMPANSGPGIIFSQDDADYTSVTSGGVLQNSITGLTRVDDGAWHHVAYVYNGTGASRLLYVDGQEDQIGTTGDQNTKSGGNWSIGRGVNGTQSFAGVIDDVRYYNRALAASEIQAIVTGDGANLAPVRVSFAQTVNVTTCASNPGITRMSYGDLSNCSINLVGEAQTFQFQGNAGDTVWFNVQRTSTYASQCYQLTDPDGIQGGLACTPYGGYSSNPQDLSYSQFLSKTGTYTIQVSGQAATFSFSLGLKRLSPFPSQIPQLTFGVASQAELLTPWDWHYYSVGGTAGDTLSIALNRETSYASQCLYVYAPTGQNVFNSCAPYNFYSDNPVTVSATLNLTQSGGYVLLVSDIDNLGSFEYSLAVNCLGACSNPLVPPPPSRCTYSLSPPSLLLSAAPVSSGLGMTAPQGCPWSVSSSASFLTFTTPVSDGGSDTIGFYVGPNTAAASQTAVVTAGGQTSTITQLGTAPLLQATPSPLAFNLKVGSQVTTTIPLNLYTNLSTLPYNASVTMTTAPALNWLTISSASGSAPATIGVTVNPSVLGPGTFSGSVTIQSPTASPSQVVVPVTVTMTVVGNAVLSVSTTPITFSLAVGGASSVAQLTVSNTGSGFLAFTAAVDPASPAAWLTVSPGSGSSSVTTPTTLAITASPGSLAAGTYSSDIVISGNGTTVHVPVTMTVSAAGAQILLSQVGLSYTGVASGGNPAPQVFGILNSGSGTLQWTASASTKSGGNWIQLSAISGTVNQPFLDVSLLTVSVNTSTLSPGDYYGTITIKGNAQNSGQTVTVVASVLTQGSDPGPQVRPTGLIFVSAPGQKPTAQQVGITNLIGAPVTYVSNPLTYNQTNWLSQSPVSATVNPSSPGTVTVQADNTSQSAGVQRGVVTLLFGDDTSTIVNVLNVVVPSGGAAPNVAGAASPELRPLASSCSSPNLQVQFISLLAGFQVPLTKPTPVSVKVVDNCGNPLVPDSTGSAASVTASFSNGDRNLPLISEGGGQWSGTWAPSQLPSSGTSVTVTIHATYFSLGSQATLQTGTWQIPGTLLTGLAPSSGSVVNLASQVQSAPAGAGSLISILGSNLASQSGTASSLPLPTDIGGTEVTLGGVKLPLLYSSAGQINAQIPYDITPNTQQQLVVRSGSTISVPVSYSIAAAQPGIFTQNLLGTGQGVIMDSKLFRYAEADTPAVRGDTVAIFCTGLGAVTPNVAPGDPAPYPFATTVNPVSVSIGGATAQVQFAGLTPGDSGVYEVYAVVPAGVAVGNSVPVTVTVAGQTSNVVTMAVK